MTHNKDAHLNGRDEGMTWARSGKSSLCLDLCLLWDKPNSSIRHEFIEHVPWAGDWEPILKEWDTLVIQEPMV